MPNGQLGDLQAIRAGMAFVSVDLLPNFVFILRFILSSRAPARNNMDMLHAMQIFAEVVETGSFTKTANKLRTYRPYVTKAVQDLEESIGVRLLHRTTRKVTLTEDGLIFHERCLQILEAVAETKDLFHQGSGKPKGKLRLDLPVSLAKSIIVPALRRFSLLYPDIELIVSAGDQPVDLIGEGIDCVVRLGNLKTSSMIARRIGSVSMLTCAAPEYLKTHKEPLTLTDLDHHVAVNYFSGPEKKVMDWQFLVEGKEVSVRLRNAVLVNDSETFVAAGVAGFGLLQAVGVTVRDHLQTGRLVPILSHIPSLPKPIWILYPHRKYLAPQVRVFIDWVSDLFANQDSV
jgi:LysR family transcriptional regulator for bpeEF and oprC